MRRQAALLSVLALAAACGGSADRRALEGVLDREVFIDTFVDLRHTALQSGTFAVTPEQREEILARHGVSEDDLLEFADAHGRDVDYMSELWSQVEARLTDRRTEASVPTP